MFACSLCKKEFRTIASLKQHALAFHKKRHKECIPIDYTNMRRYDEQSEAEIMIESFYN